MRRYATAKKKTAKKATKSTKSASAKKTTKTPKAASAKEATKKTGSGAKTPRATKKTTRTSKTAKKPTRSRAKKSTGTSPEERHRMIAQAAFRRAIEHGVRDRDPLRDWLEAEAEVDAQLAARGSKKKAPRKGR